MLSFEETSSTFPKYGPPTPAPASQTRISTAGSSTRSQPGARSAESRVIPPDYAGAGSLRALSQRGPGTGGRGVRPTA